VAEPSTVLQRNRRLHGPARLRRAEQRLAILGFAAPLTSCTALTGQNRTHWLSRCDQVKPTDLMELHRHNLQWLVEPLKAQLGEDFWPLVESLNTQAGLDLRVNTLKGQTG
jgi:16S rRNA (cytosine967-C5)-methyltransferase